MQRALVLISKLKLRAFGASPDPYKDVDEMIQNDEKRFKKLLKNKTDLFSFLFSQKVENLNPSNYSDITSTLNWVRNILSKVPSESLRAIYINSLLNIKFFDPDMISDIKKELLNPSTRKEPYKRGSEEDKKDHISRQEEFLALLLIHDNISIPDDIELKYFTNEDISKILKFIKKKGKVTKKVLLKEDFKEYIEDAIFHFSEIDEQDDIDILYNLIKKDYFEQKEKELKKQISIAETRNDIKESEKLLKKFHKLIEERKNETRNS
jgi:hypothetical protein